MEEQEETVPTTTNTSEQLEADNAATTGGSGRTTGEKAEAERETTGRSTAEGAVAENMANPGKTKAPERKADTHQENKSAGEGSKIIGGTNYAGTSNGEISGMITHARCAKKEGNKDMDDGET